MQFLVYAIVLLISVGTVMFGVDWLQAPMSPMPASKYELRAAKPPAKPVVQQAATAKPAVAPQPPVATAVVAPAPTLAPVAQNVPQPAPLVAPEQPGLIPEPVEVAAPAPRCDLEACERAYRTFTASDCTYQPSGDGPRRLCTRGTPPQASPVPNARAQATCNIAACSNAYISFNASDCTYQPSNGPRRLCER